MIMTQYVTATTIDGYIADEHPCPDWPLEIDSTGHDQFGSFFARVGAIAMGATTYEWVLRHEKLLDDPGKWRE